MRGSTEEAVAFLGKEVFNGAWVSGKVSLDRVQEGFRCSLGELRQATTERCPSLSPLAIFQRDRYHPWRHVGRSLSVPCAISLCAHQG